MIELCSVRTVKRFPSLHIWILKVAMVAHGMTLLPAKLCVDENLSES